MRPLAGIRVVEASTYVLGPFAALQMADLGAEVIKVESPRGGDPLRSFSQRRNGVSLVFANCNRNKQSVFLDLKTDAGTHDFEDLLSSADVLVTNWRPAVAERLGFSEDWVRAKFPRLIWVRITGFGQTGPLAESPAFDAILQARSGYAARAEGRPQLSNGYLADKVTGTFAAQSALAALLQRHSTGLGCVVDVSMLDAMAYFDSPDLFAGHTSADDRPDRGLLQHLESVRPLRTNDGWMVVSPVSGRQLSATVRAVGHPEWSQDLKTATNVTEMTTILYDRLDTVMTSRSTAEWEKVFHEADVPASEFFDMDAHILDPQVRHNDLYRTAYDPILGEVRRARAPGLFDGTVVQTDDLPVPRLP